MWSKIENISCHKWSKIENISCHKWSKIENISIKYSDVVLKNLNIFSKS